MDDLFDLADDLGPEKILHIHNPAAGLRAVVAIDNVALGPAIGGVRMAPDVSAVEAVRLARAMTLKNAAARLPHGGGKSVIYGNPGDPPAVKERRLRAFAAAIETLTEYIPGPDMGTDETCMAWVRDEIGRAVGLPRALGGIPLDEIGATGWGLYHAIRVALREMEMALEGARVVVQGFGAVGSNAAKFLVEGGAVLVGTCDINGAIYDPDGLELERLLELRDAGKTLAEYPGGKKLGRDEVVGIECEIWIPAARPDVVDRNNVDRLRTRIVAQGANIPFTWEAERRLHQQGVLVLPDFIANAGGVICAAVEWRGGTEDEAFDTIARKIRENTETVLRKARAEGRPPREAAEVLARRRVLQAMRFGRFSGSALANAPGETRVAANIGDLSCTASGFTEGEARG